MTKQELEQAIKNSEDVWYITGKDVRGLKITKKDLQRITKFDEVYKTKAEAEHYLNHANITRTETLPFLTWEEFCEQKFIWFIDKNQNVCCLYYLNVSNKIFINVSGEVKEIGDLTEANFYKAYDECVRLFRSEE